MFPTLSKKFGANGGRERQANTLSSRLSFLLEKMSFRFMAPSPPPPPPPNVCIDCRVGLCEEGRSRLFGASMSECEAMEDAGVEEFALIDSLTNSTGTRACIDVRATPHATSRKPR